MIKPHLFSLSCIALEKCLHMFNQLKTSLVQTNNNSNSKQL